MNRDHRLEIILLYEAIKDQRIKVCFIFHTVYKCAVFAPKVCYIFPLILDYANIV